MRTITDLLRRYTRIQQPEAVTRKAFVEAVERVIGVAITPEQVRIHKNTATLMLPAVLKHEIILHKKEVLHAMAEASGTDAAITTIL